MKDINIVIVNYFNKEETLRAVKSIFFDLENSNFDFIVVVVDNSQNKDNIQSDLEAKFSKVKYINTGSNLGFGKANNIGFKAYSARYYFALNSDAYLEENKNTIAELINFLDRNKKIGIVGPKLKNLDNSLQHSCYRFNKSSILVKPFKHINWQKKYKKIKVNADKLLMGDFDHNETRPVDWVLGAAMVIRHEAVEKTGWFDERYFMYLEDADLCMRMWESGWPVYYLHNICVYHKYSRESSKIPGIFRALIKNKLARIHLLSWLKYMWKWRKHFKFYE